MSQRPLPAEVYWRRRLLLLAALILIAWGVVRVWPSGAGAGSDPVTAPTPSSTPAPSAEPTDAAAPTPESEPTDDARATATVTLATGEDRCDPEQVRITPAVPPGQAAGGTVEVDLVVSSTASKPCRLTPKDARLVAVISSGSTAVWDSDVCRTALLQKPVELSPRWSTVVPTTWSGRGSGPGCSSTEGFAPKGTYTLRVGTLGGEPGRTKFTLGARVKKAEAGSGSEADTEKAETEKAEAAKAADEAAERD